MWWIIECICWEGSKQNYSQLLWFNMLTLHDPVVEIVVEVAISFLEVQLLEHFAVVHQVEAVVHVIFVDFCQDECVSDEFVVGDFGGEVHEGIAGLRISRQLTYSILCLSCFITCDGKE